MKLMKKNYGDLAQSIMKKLKRKQKIKQLTEFL